MKTITPSLFVLLFLAGCATTGSQTQTETAAAEKVVCQRETPTGSNIPVTRCRTETQTAIDKRNAEEVTDALHGTSGGMRKGPGGN